MSLNATTMSDAIVRYVRELEGKLAERDATLERLQAERAEFWTKLTAPPDNTSALTALMRENRELQERLRGAAADLDVANAARHALAAALRAAEDKIAEQHDTAITLRQRVRELEEVLS